ncbi:alcohol dehydrogenase 1-like [Bombina bombina]|uniref:alcohol dehydrogenase 1-like n=1 Tax=Bombina bombina TaxID=8345 RepID=UPI00235A9D55|nr:alcohol dehydrogenase 1-like [Bombina bombina]
MTDGGVDYAIECIGNVDIMTSALLGAHHGCGTSVIVGLAPASVKMNFGPALMLTGRKLAGGLFGGWKSKEAVPKLVSEFMDNKSQLDGLISYKFPFEKINEGFELLRKGESICTVLEF